MPLSESGGRRGRTDYPDQIHRLRFLGETGYHRSLRNFSSEFESRGKRHKYFKVGGPDGKGIDCNSIALHDSNQFDSDTDLQTNQKDSYVAEQEVQHVCCKTIQAADRNYGC